MKLVLVITENNTTIPSFEKTSVAVLVSGIPFEPSADFSFLKTRKRFLGPSSFGTILVSRAIYEDFNQRDRVAGDISVSLIIISGFQMFSHWNQHDVRVTNFISFRCYDPAYEAYSVGVLDPCTTLSLTLRYRRFEIKAYFY